MGNVCNIFLDMDYTLAKFPAEHGELGTKRYKTQSGFFAKLKPYKNIELVNQALKKNKNTFILSNSPNEIADKDKKTWIKQYLPNMPLKRCIFNRGGLTAEKTKAEIAESKLNRKLLCSDILIDDSVTNCEEWVKAGGTAILKSNKKKTNNCKYSEVTRLAQIGRIIEYVASEYFSNTVINFPV